MNLATPSMSNVSVCEDGVFWYIPGEMADAGQDPFGGIDSSYSNALQAAYEKYCLSVVFGEDYHTALGHDIDEYLLDEGKSLDKFMRPAKRLAYGQKIRSDTSYQRLIKRQETSASREVEAEANKFESELAALVQKCLKKRLSQKSLRDQTAKMFADMYQRMWGLGRDASGILLLQKKPGMPSRDEEKWFRSAVREELTYWQSFLDELFAVKGDFTNKRYSVEDRVAMYARTTTFMYNAGRLSGMPENVLLYWWPKKKASGVMCPGCVYMVKNSPFTRDNMPTIPRAGDTPCLMHCVHKVVVKYATKNAVDRRRREQPSRASMLSELRRIMGSKIQKYRGKTKVYNPWLGQSTWGQLK